MEIKIDYYLGKNLRLMHTVISDEDIEQMIIDKFRDGQLACPIPFDCETCEIEVSIDKVIV
jgi:hypothetical protein